MLSRILETHLGRQPASVLDPACGPGTWLEPFARQSIFVAGNDLSPKMVEFARPRFPSQRSEITEGDMLSLNFCNGPFEAAFEMSGALGMLLDVSSILSFLDSLGRVLLQGGIALLDAHFRDGRRKECLPSVCWSQGPVPLASGQRASVVYEILREDTKAGIEWVRRIEGHNFTSVIGFCVFLKNETDLKQGIVMFGWLLGEESVWEDQECLVTDQTDIVELYARHFLQLHGAAKKHEWPN